MLCLDRENKEVSKVNNSYLEDLLNNSFVE